MSNLDTALSALQQQVDSISTRLVEADLVQLEVQCHRAKAAMICDGCQAVAANGCQRVLTPSRPLGSFCGVFKGACNPQEQLQMHYLRCLSIEQVAD